MHSLKLGGSVKLGRAFWGSFWLVCLGLVLLVTAALKDSTVTHAAPLLTITPVTWNIVGLDASDINAGPNIFPVGARVCNLGDSQATNVVVNFSWDSQNEYISLLDPGTSSLAFLEASSCVDFSFTIDVARDPDAFETARSYHITAAADGLSEISTPLPREIYVERLEARQPDSSPQIQGPQQVFVGQVYQYEVTSQLDPDGLEQVNQYLDFPVGMFQVLEIASNFSVPAGATSDTPYIDACGWDSNPESDHYRSCTGPPRIPGDRVGGTVTTSYTVKVLAAGNAGISWMVHDFSAQNGYAYLAEAEAAPFWITAIPQQETPTRTVTLIITSTTTATLPTETLTPTLTDTPTDTPTPSETPTETITPTTVTPTFTPTDTPTPSETPTQTGTPPTATPTSTSTSTPTATATATPTSTPTITGTPPTATPTGTITPNPSLTKTTSKSSAKVGETFTFTIKITNNGAASASTVNLTDILSSYLDLVSVTTTKGTATPYYTTRTATVSVGTVAPAETVTITIVARVNSTVKVNTTVTNVATMTYIYGTTITKTASVSVTVQPSSTLPGTGFAPLEQGGGSSNWLGMATTILFAVGGALALGYSLLARLLRWPRLQASLTLGVVLLTAALVVGLAVWRPAGTKGLDGSQAQRPGFSIARVEPGSVVQPPVSDDSTGEAVNSLPTPEILETLPDYPVPTPVLTVTPGPGEAALDTSQVVRITIPSLGVDTIVKYVPFDGLTWLISGLQQEVAWLGETSWPGLGGNTALAGHVVVRNGAPGPFYKLSSLSPGDEVVLYTQENIYHYQVREQQVVEETDVSAVEPSAQAQLTLVTCTDWDSNLHLYLKRRVVFADLEEVEPQAEQHGN